MKQVFFDSRTKIIDVYFKTIENQAPRQGMINKLNSL